MAGWSWLLAMPPCGPGFDWAVSSGFIAMSPGGPAFGSLAWALPIIMSGFGPAFAAAGSGAFSGLPAPDLISYIRRGEVEKLVRIPGIGKKTAERMVLELREKMLALAAELPERSAAVPADQDVVSALVNLGYKASLAERAVAEVRREKPDAAFNDLLRASLNRLSRA